MSLPKRAKTVPVARRTIVSGAIENSPRMYRRSASVGPHHARLPSPRVPEPRVGVIFPVSWFTWSIGHVLPREQQPRVPHVEQKGYPPVIESLGICIYALRRNLPRVGQDFPVPQYPQAPLDGGALPDQTLDALILDGSSPPPLPSCSHNRWSIDAQGLDALREQAIAFCPPWEMSRGKMPVVETQQGQLCQNTVPCLCDALPRMGKHLLKHGPTSLAWDCPSLHWNTSRSDV